jgi:acyl dehydratase
VPVNPDLAGRTYAATSPYLVGREKVREFARAVFASDRVSLSVEAAQAAGFADVVAPPTFAVVIQEQTLAQLLADGDAGIDFARVVHGDQRFSYTRPIVAGDELTATLEVTSVKTLAGNAMVTAESTIRDASGAHVVTAISTLVVRAEAPEAEAPEAEAPEAEAPEAEVAGEAHA